MKPITRQFLKFAALMWLPTYGVILWLFLYLGHSYFVSWCLTNIAYILVMFPLYRKGVFELK